MKKTKSIYILTFVLIVISMIIFELLYCNPKLIKHIIFGVQNGAVYNFSFNRILIYILITVLIVVFRKKIINILEETKSIKFKKYIILAYSIIAVLGIIYTTYIFLTDINTSLQAIAMGYLSLILIGICIIYLSNDYIKNVIVIFSTISILFLTTVNINSALDEKKHFMSAYCVSTGQLDFQNAKLDKSFYELGHFVQYKKAEDLFENNFKENLEYCDMTDIPSTPADYNPVLYLPAGIGILIAKTFSNNMGDIYLTGRLFNLMAYACLIIITLKILPYKKNTFIVIFLMPMLIAMASIYSIDAIITGITAVFIAYCLRLKETNNVKLKDIIILMFLLVMLSLAKTMAYIFVALIVFILPISKILKQNKKYIPIIVVGLILTLGICYFLNFGIRKVDADPRGGETSISGQIEYIKGHPKQMAFLGINYIKTTFFNFGWLSELNHRVYFYSSADVSTIYLLFAILFIAITDNSHNFKAKEKIWMILGFLLTFGITSIILYITYTPVGADDILGYQARYLFPILPLILMCISNSNIKIKDEANQNIKIAYISTLFISLCATGSILMK